jgi:hypothetical protein
MRTRNIDRDREPGRRRVKCPNCGFSGCKRGRDREARDGSKAGDGIVVETITQHIN